MKLSTLQLYIYIRITTMLFRPSLSPLPFLKEFWYVIIINYPSTLALVSLSGNNVWTGQVMRIQQVVKSKGCLIAMPETRGSAKGRVKAALLKYTRSFSIEWICLRSIRSTLYGSCSCLLTFRRAGREPLHPRRNYLKPISRTNERIQGPVSPHRALLYKDVDREKNGRALPAVIPIRGSTLIRPRIINDEEFSRCVTHSPSIQETKRVGRRYSLGNGEIARDFAPRVQVEAYERCRRIRSANGTETYTEASS